MVEAMQIGMFLVLIIVVIVLAVLLARCKNNEKFCGTCQGMSNKVCTNRPLMSHLYQTGHLTENSARERHPGWPSITWDHFQNYGKKEHPCRDSAN